jgi:hypothetical protein
MRNVSMTAREPMKTLGTSQSILTEVTTSMSEEGAKELGKPASQKIPAKKICPKYG